LRNVRRDHAQHEQDRDRDRGDADGDRPVLSPAAVEPAGRAQDRAAVDVLMAEVSAARSLQDAAAIEAVNQTLAKGTEAFAAMRMNRGIHKALAGRNIETV
jgi:molecular chaperone HscA